MWCSCAIRETAEEIVEVYLHMYIIKMRAADSQASKLCWGPQTAVEAVLPAVVLT